MTIDELFDRLSTYPRDAHITGCIEPGTDRAGLMVVWNDKDQIRTSFIETRVLPEGMTPARPKKAR